MVEGLVLEVHMMSSLEGVVVAAAGVVDDDDDEEAGVATVVEMPVAEL